MHRIDIELESLAQRGRQRWRVRYADEVLIERSRNPEFDACRALLERGITGRLEVWHRGAAYPAMRLDIEKAAKLTVEENGSIGPRLTRWAPRPEGIDQDADSHSGDSPRAGTDEI